jgi:hypothetical protein
LALERVLSLPAAPDRLVRTLSCLRGLRGADLPRSRFAIEVIGLVLVAHSDHRRCRHRLPQQNAAIAFAAEIRPDGWLATHHRDAGCRY